MTSDTPSREDCIAWLERGSVSSSETRDAIRAYLRSDGLLGSSSSGAEQRSEPLISSPADREVIERAKAFLQAGGKSPIFRAANPRRRWWLEPEDLRALIALASRAGETSEGWKLVPRGPGSCELDDSAWLLIFLNALHRHLPEDERPTSWHQFSDDQRQRIADAWRAAVDAAPTPPVPADSSGADQAAHPYDHTTARPWFYVQHDEDDGYIQSDDATREVARHVAPADAELILRAVNSPSDALTELVADETEIGRVTWFSSGEDEGPDCGLGLGLNDGASLYLGEMPKSTLIDHGIETETGDGWWLVLYDGKRTEIAARVVDGDAARALFDRLATALAAVVGNQK